MKIIWYELEKANIDTLSRYIAYATVGEARLLLFRPYEWYKYPMESMLHGKKTVVKEYTAYAIVSEARLLLLDHTNGINNIKQYPIESTLYEKKTLDWNWYTTRQYHKFSEIPVNDKIHLIVDRDDMCCKPKIKVSSRTPWNVAWKKINFICKSQKFVASNGTVKIFVYDNRIWTQICLNDENALMLPSLIFH